MILVTGGAGYVGSVLVRELLQVGETVRVVDTQWFGNSLPVHECLQVVKGDIRYCEPSWLDGIRAVIHLAGLSNDPTADFSPRLNSESNVLATRELARAVAEKASQEHEEVRFLYASSCSVYYSDSNLDDANVEVMSEETPVAPTANYSKAKCLAEVELSKLADRHALFCPVTLRKGTIFGLSPRMRFDLVLNTFVLQAWRERILTVHGHGEVWRPLLHIRDAVDAYIHLLWAPTERIRGQIFNVLHKNYRILELAHWVAESLEQERDVEVRVKRDRAKGDGARSYYVSGDKISRLLGFRAARGARQGVLEIWDVLEQGFFGANPQADPKYFNIRQLRESLEVGVLE
jgi:nucleoside-diphosphate-sugar epimerase